MKFKYKFISLFLVIVMTISIMPNFVFADDGELPIRGDFDSEYLEISEPAESEWYDESTFVLDSPNIDAEEYIDEADVYYGDMELLDRMSENIYPEPDLSIYDINQETPYEIANNIQPPQEVQSELNKKETDSAIQSNSVDSCNKHEPNINFGKGCLSKQYSMGQYVELLRLGKFSKNISYSTQQLEYNNLL